MDGEPVRRERLKNENVFELIQKFGYYEPSCEFFRLAVSDVNGSAFEAGAKAFLVPFGDLAKRNTSNL